ncbi:MAG: epoxyqueuosine reductase QueH [Lachnospiraceae bacterium]|nr:epoxyqueuosine reductase QueH [Lachnospiraceae bacterium]
MQNRNYQKELEKMIERHTREGEKPRLLLHSCCAPCSSHCLEYLKDKFEITVFYYNPNIWPEEEYHMRVEEQARLIQDMNAKLPGADISLIVGSYDPERFSAMAAGKETLPEGGERCFGCFSFRLFEAAKEAKAGGFDYFTTTLTISPLKNAPKLNEIGETLAKQLDVAWLPSDFKKKNGYLRSTQLSEEYGLYRQNYCGCEFSRKEL